MKSSKTIGRISLVLFRHIKKRTFKEIYYWITFLARSFIFTSFAKIMEFNTLLHYLDVKEGEKLCDLGSGYGSNDVLLSLAGAQTYAVDVDRDTLNLAKNNADRLQVNVNYCIADLNKTISFGSQSFDKVVSYCVLEHLSNSEGFLSEVNRILRPKGILALSVDSFSYHKITNFKLSV